MKFTDVNPFNKKIQKKINNSILNTVKRGDFILGEKVKKFERKFAKLSGTKYAVGCATGTDALLLALKCINLKKKSRSDYSRNVIYFYWTLCCIKQ